MTASTIRTTHGTDAESIGRRATRTASAAVAAAIALLVTFVATSYGADPFVGLGIPSAAAVGAWLGPSVRDRGGLGGPVIAMAIVTILLAEALLLVGWLFQSASITSSGDAGDLIGTIVVLGWAGVIGLVIIGGPMLLLTTPCAIAWALILRQLVRHGHGARPAP